MYALQNIFLTLYIVSVVQSGYHVAHIHSFIMQLYATPRYVLVLVGHMYPIYVACVCDFEMSRLIFCNNAISTFMETTMYFQCLVPLVLNVVYKPSSLCLQPFIFFLNTPLTMPNLQSLRNCVQTQINGQFLTGMSRTTYKKNSSLVDHT